MSVYIKFTLPVRHSYNLHTRVGSTVATPVTNSNLLDFIIVIIFYIQNK